MATDSFSTYASVATTLGRVANLSGAGHLGGVLGTGGLNVDDGDTNAIRVVSHIPSDGATVFDSFAYRIAPVRMPPGRPCMAVSFHFMAKVDARTPPLTIGLGVVTASTTWAGGTAAVATYPVSGASYALHEQPFDSHAVDEASLLLWATDQNLVNALLAGTASVLIESSTATAHTAAINVTTMAVRCWYANTSPSLDHGVGRLQRVR